MKKSKTMTIVHYKLFFCSQLLLLMMSSHTLCFAELQIIIAGPTRSGTSFLAYVVQQLGFKSGRVRSQPFLERVNTIKGTHENLQLMHLEDKLLRQLHGNVNKPPSLLPDEELLQWFCSNVQSILNEEGIEFYKSNRAPVIANIWNNCFPNVKWIWIQRNFNDRYMSRERFMDKHKNDVIEFKESHAAILHAWAHSIPADGALHLTFEDFDSVEKREQTFEKIADFLSVQLTVSLLDKLHSLYRPVVQKGDTRIRQLAQT